MKKYVMTNDIKKIENKKGEILANSKTITLVKTADIFTVWMPEDGFVITHTFDQTEAWNTFVKYASA